MNNDKKNMEWSKDGSCLVRGKIVSKPSELIPERKDYFVEDRNGISFGYINPVTGEGRKELEKFDGKYVKFRSSSPLITPKKVRMFFLREETVQEISI